MTTFHLVRHAAHGELGRLLTGRTPGVPLSEQGRGQAEALARRLKRERIDALCASPQLRALQTAEPLAGLTGLQPRIAAELDEIDFGAWSGKRFAALEADPAWRRWNEERDDARTPAGEGMDDVADRLSRLVERLHSEFPRGTVALFSHADVIKAGLCRYRGRPFQDAHAFDVAPASVSTIAAGEDGVAVLAVNDIAHLATVEAAA